MTEIWTVKLIIQFRVQRTGTLSEKLTDIDKLDQKKVDRQQKNMDRKADISSLNNCKQDTD